MADNFNAVYNTYYQKSFLFVQSYVYDEMVAEDIVSESLIKLWKLMKQKEIGEIAPLLFTILRNRSLDHLKHEAVKKSAHTRISQLHQRDLEIRLTTLEACNPEEIFSSEVKEIIRITLDSLPEKTRQVFEMSRFSGKPYKEIAQELNIIVKGVDYHITKAMTVLRIALKDYLPVYFFLFLPQ